MRTGSTITGNTNSSYNGYGGGVYMDSGTFEMTGGNISGNIARTGGGVYSGGAYGRGTFTMSGGTISGNTASYGGGIYVQKDSPFNMGGGIFTGNTAREYGGGVCLEGQGPGDVSFNKTGGTITGYNSDPNNGNVVRDESGNVLSRMGHAVYLHYFTITSVRRKETTAGPGVNLSFRREIFSGAWDN